MKVDIVWDKNSLGQSRGIFSALHHISLDAERGQHIPVQTTCTASHANSQRLRCLPKNQQKIFKKQKRMTTWHEINKMNAEECDRQKTDQWPNIPEWILSTCLQPPSACLRAACTLRIWNWCICRRCPTIAPRPDILLLR